MASIIPIAAQALALFQTASSVASIFDNSAAKQQNQALQQLQQLQNLQFKNDAQNVAISKQQIETQAQNAEQQRRNALKPIVAKQRAEFGASGVVGGDGSSKAVLLGLFSESDQERQSREQLDTLKIKALEQGLSQQSQVNTLKRTQLAAKQRFDNSTSTFDDISALLNVF